MTEPRPDMTNDERAEYDAACDLAEPIIVGIMGRMALMLTRGEVEDDPDVVGMLISELSSAWRQLMGPSVLARRGPSYREAVSFGVILMLMDKALNGPPQEDDDAA